MKSYYYDNLLLKFFVILFFYVYIIIAKDEMISDLNQQRSDLQRIFLVPLDGFYIKKFHDNSNSSSVDKFPHRKRNIINSKVKKSSHEDESEKLYFGMNDIGVSVTNNAVTERKCAFCTCGIPNRRRIVGGNIVRTNKYPWIAQLHYFRIFYCGGSLINDRYILTAAHCTKGFDKSHITVILLQLDQSSSRTGIERNVSNVIRPDSYNIQTLENDISLIKLNAPVNIQGNMKPICLPSLNGQYYTGHIATVAGWGATYENDMSANILHELEIPILSNDRCKRTVYKDRIKSTMLCAGYLAGGKDACQGDSGGPLMVSNGVAYEQAGIVSWGYGCARPNSPGVYTRVTQFLQWIMYHTTDACYCKGL